MEIKTNADKIRNMTDEELAELMYDSFSIFNCSDCEMGYYGTCLADCRKYILNWLRKEVN